MTYEEIGDRLIRDVEQLGREAQYIYDNVVLPQWETQPHRYWATLYGLVMSAFAAIDLASVYWRGNRDDQTRRMSQFMDEYLSEDPEANDVALQMWRHSLMHTGQPRILLDQRTQRRYRWLLHWSSDKLSPLEHFTFEGHHPEKKLNLTLLDLIRDVRDALKRYAEQLNGDPTLQRKCLDAHPLIECQAFKSRPRGRNESEERRLYKRVVQSGTDLGHAAECAEQILDRELHSATVRSGKRLLRCLNTALVVSYWSPFSGNRATKDVRKRLPAEYLDVLSDKQRILHRQIGEARNRDQAHSDPQGRETKVSVTELGEVPMAMAISRDAHAPLPKKVVEELARMIGRLRSKLAEEQRRLEEKMKPGERF